MPSYVYVILLAHYIADFKCQTNWMAVNKSKNWAALFMHVTIYAFVLGLIVAFQQPPSEYPYDSALAFFSWLGVNGIVHFAQDAITSRITSRFWFVSVSNGQLAADDAKRHWFFNVIGIDQLLHYLVLFKTAEWWLQ